MGLKNVVFSPNKPMGVNPIGKLLKVLCKLAGIQQWDSEESSSLSSTVFYHEDGK